MLCKRHQKHWNKRRAQKPSQAAEVFCAAAYDSLRRPGQAIAVYHKNDIYFGPAKAANAGGVAVSGLEMCQNSMRLLWSREEVEEKLKGIMKDIFDNAQSVRSLRGCRATSCSSSPVRMQVTTSTWVCACIQLPNAGNVLGSLMLLVRASRSGQ